MPKRYATVFTQCTAFCRLPFRELHPESPSKKYSKTSVIIFKHAVVFLYIFAESNVATTVQLYRLNSFCKLHHAKIFKNLLLTANILQRLVLFKHVVVFLYIFAESCVALTAFQFVGKLTQKCLF